MEHYGESSFNPSTVLHPFKTNGQNGHFIFWAEIGPWFFTE
jgi:hypothetical protein